MTFSISSNCAAVATTRSWLVTGLASKRGWGSATSAAGVRPRAARRSSPKSLASAEATSTALLLTRLYVRTCVCQGVSLTSSLVTIWAISSILDLGASTTSARSPGAAVMITRWASSPAGTTVRVRRP